jgi:LPS-assembly lipoprotein
MGQPRTTIGLPGRRAFLRLGGLAATTASLAGCGIHPLYAPNAFGGDDANAAVQQHLREVQVGFIPDRDGQLLRYALQDRLEAGQTAEITRYDLIIRYNISSIGLGLLNDNTTTYARIIAVAAWSLNAQDADRTVLTKSVSQAVDGLNSFDNQPFAQDLEVEVVHKRLANALADQITLRLAHYFTATGRAQEQGKPA